MRPKLDSIKDLDTILEFMNSDKRYDWKSLKEIMGSLGSLDEMMVTDVFLVDQMMLKLGKDEYVIEKKGLSIKPEEHLLGPRFKITFEGSLFIQRGGYGGEIDREAAESIQVERLRTAQVVSQRNMVVLTVLLAIAAGLPAVKAGQDIATSGLVPCASWSSMALAFLFGCCLTGLIWLLSGLRRKQKQ